MLVNEGKCEWRAVACLCGGSPSFGRLCLKFLLVRLICEFSIPKHNKNCSLKMSSEDSYASFVNNRSGTVSPGIKTPLLEKTLQLTQVAHRAKSNLMWGAVNATGLSFLIYDMYYTCPHYTSLVYYIEIFVAVVLGLNTLYHAVSYIWNTACAESVTVTPEQKKLLGVKHLDSFIKVSQKPATEDKDSSQLSQSGRGLSSTRLNFSALSWRSSGMSPTLSESETMEQPTNFLSSYWKTPSMRKSELSPVSGRYVYQLATPSPVQVSTSPSSHQTEEPGSPSSLQNKNLEVWRRLSVDVKVLTQWTANLRMWISQTVLDRLVREISSVNEAFARHGLADMQIGSVGLERLKKTAQTLPVVQNIPTLPLIVPFLEVTTNQEYLLARIKELAKGGAMSEFRWNSGGSFHGKDWEEHLPTDSAVVMHLLASYFDSQLPPLPHNPEGRPFTSQYFLKSTEKLPKGKTFPIINEVQTNPPHYVLMVGDEKLELAKGRNNLFHTILLFLHQLKTREHGMLGRVNLGPSGINILWVIDS
ncbi:transmembrane protein 209 isoform X2 [Schistocerca gregaria]|uniref:transmembrane protein 209 isoform X2 n=1 Tax=Schistocerca gregaria TaxID=7010 RepID=UPI00211F3684|nr:transmembrane protein 209 isoform X2 [Schistocerca gregaria]